MESVNYWMIDDALHNKNSLAIFYAVLPLSFSMGGRSDKGVQMNSHRICMKQRERERERERTEQNELETVKMLN